jgi:hypothetical protein
MSIELKGIRVQYVIDESHWIAVEEIAREFGWVPEYERKVGRTYSGDDVPEHNARALARALYEAIHMIEADSLSESLVELVKSAGVGNMRAVADLAATGTFYAD